MKFEQFLLICDNDELLHVYLGKDTLNCTSILFSTCGELIARHKFYNFTVHKFFSDKNYNGSFRDETITEVYITAE